MYLIRFLIRTLLFIAFGAVAAFAVSEDWARVSYFVMVQEGNLQTVDLANVSRAPPTASTDVMTTGTALAQTGDMRALDGMETAEAAFAFLHTTIATNNVPLKPLVDPSTNVASAQRTQHILHGDATGGGHLWPGGAGKTPFPQDWDANRIMSTTSDLATNPNLLWKPQTGNGGLYTRSGKPARFVVTDANGNLPVVDGVPVRVIIEPAGEGIITAYPKY